MPTRMRASILRYTNIACVIILPSHIGLGLPIGMFPLGFAYKSIRIPIHSLFEHPNYIS
jgi:hypothetical protein